MGLLFKKKRGRDIEFKCTYCGKFVAYDDPDVRNEVDMNWDYRTEDVREDYIIYHKKCKEKEESEKGRKD